MRLPLFTHTFQISGLNLERFINLMQQKGIPLLHVNRTADRALSCKCYSADLAAIRCLAEEKGWKLHFLRPSGLSRLLYRLKKRPGIPAGAVLTLACILLLSRYVWYIDVQNAGPYQAEIVSYLSENGYHAGIPRKHVDAETLENILLQRYPELAWFHVYVTNVTLVVEVSAGAAMPDFPEAAHGDVLAARSGIVQSIRVFAGSAAVKPGDVVQKGDLLIRGAERGRDGQENAVRAEGVIIARCWDSFTAHVPLYEISSAETGREAVFVRIHTPWFDWPKTVSGPAFLASNLYISQTPVAGIWFPVFRQTMLYREVSMERSSRALEEVREEAAQAALSQLKNALFGDEIIDKWVDYCMIEGDTLAATATAERLVDIGVFSAP